MRKMNGEEEELCYNSHQMLRHYNRDAQKGSRLTGGLWYFLNLEFFFSIVYIDYSHKISKSKPKATIILGLDTLHLSSITFALSLSLSPLLIVFRHYSRIWFTSPIGPSLKDISTSKSAGKSPKTGADLPAVPAGGFCLKIPATPLLRRDNVDFILACLRAYCR